MRSPQSTGPQAQACPHAPKCVPCPLRGLAYREQLARKRSTLVDALARYPSLAGAEIEETVGSRDLFGYRNVAKLVVRSGRDGRLRAGVYEPGSHRFTDAAGCSVHHPAINEAVEAALAEASRLGIPAYDERSRHGELRYLVARYSAFTRKVLLILVTASRERGSLRELVRRLPKRCRAIGGIVQNVNADPGNVILGREWATLRPPAGLLERIGAFRLATSPGAFLQANLWTARRIYETVLAWADPQPDETAIDLFCGVGPLTLYLAGRAGLVLGVEEVAEAVRDAKSNARRNGVHNARFHSGAAEKILPALGERVDRAAIVTLNPPRKGALPEALDAVAKLEPRRVVYVSCDPTTLARDLDRLASGGYRAVRVRPFDMMPQTDHVEVVAMCDRAPAAGSTYRR